MTCFKTAAMVLTLAALTGCVQGEPGGPGTAVAPEKQATVGQTEDTFNLSVPLTSTSLQQGGQTEDEAVHGRLWGLRLSSRE